MLRKSLLALAVMLFGATSVAPASAQSQASKAAGTGEDEGRIVLIVLDDMTAAGAAVIPWVKAAAHRLVAQLAPDDLAAVVFTSDKNDEHNFTRDRIPLRTAVDNFRGPGAVEDDYGVIPSNVQSLLANRSLPIRLGQLAEAMGKLPQLRKTMLLVSTLRVYSTNADLDVSVSGERFHLIQEFLATAKRANVSVYGVDPRGLAPPETRYPKPHVVPRGAISAQATMVTDPAKETGDLLWSLSAQSEPLALEVAAVSTAGDAVTAFVRIYQGGGNETAAVILTARIFDDSGAKVFETIETIGRDRFSATRAADYKLAVPIGRLKPGRHRMVVEAKLGGDSTRREVIFTIQ